MKRRYASRSLALLGAVCFALALATTTYADSPSITGNGGFSVGVGWTPNPPTKVATVDVYVACQYGYTCGYTKVTIDWDDGHYTDYYSYLPINWVSFQHEYDSNGSPHVKVYGEDEDENGNWFDVRPIDITISS